MMGGSSFPFCAWPPRGLPGCHWPGLSHGHRVYRGTGGISGVDFARPAGHAQCDATVIRLAGLGHEPLARYTYVARPVAGAAWLETPDLSNACEVETDAGGDWLGGRPAGVEWLSAEVLSAGRITVSWSYRAPPGRPVPTDFGVYCRTGPRIVSGSPSAVVDYTRDGTVSHTFDLADGASYWFAVTARCGGVESRVPAPIGPFVADASTPSAPLVTVSRTF
jgi:hypothetical protein